MFSKISGYGHIESLKNQVVENEAAIVAKRQAARNAKIEYDEAVARRSNSQKEVNDLLQRKSTWTESDVSRFTALVRQDHLYEQEETRAKLHVESTEADVEHQFNELMRTILNRYHEEQVWSDKIRSVSTYGSLLALGVNIFIFILAILVVEPWKRKRLAETFEKRIEHLSIENRELIRKGLEDFAAHFEKQETVLTKMEHTLEDISIPKSSEDSKSSQYAHIVTKGSLEKEKWFIGLLGAAGGVALTTILTYLTS
ncbi:hypothetical protein Clacol_009970 [Clathrus columnatus]|uniref:Sensitive to high expression protein 9, mitochondrial n=1 Tax=Clathrus columnatus TaxID=1419009 RepID=A0AAV5ALY8_9AGAM|nr:hypothetical protein Clacol_009970 [Clathrus columnatus]